MVQPPADTRLGEACIMHYTWGSIIKDRTETKLWEYDKRTYNGGQFNEGPYVLHTIDLPPEWDPMRGFHLQDGAMVTESGLGLIKLLIVSLNDAISKLPVLPLGFSDRNAAVAAAKASPESVDAARREQKMLAEQREAAKNGQ